MGREHKDLDKMTKEDLDKMTKEDLDKIFQAFRPPRGQGRRGRPRRRFSKAYAYTQQYLKFRQEGVSPWRAIKQVAELNRKTPEHIAACRKLVEDTDPMEYMVDDYVDLLRESLDEAESSSEVERLVSSTASRIRSRTLEPLTPVPTAACQANTSRSSINDEDDADDVAVPASDL